MVARSGILGKLPPTLASLHDLMPTVSLRKLRMRQPAYVPAKGKRRVRVGLW